MKSLLLFFCSFLVFPIFAQKIKTKDGVVIGERNDFILTCTKGAEKKMIQFNGFEFEAKNYCTCVCDNLIPQIYNWEMEKAMKENKIADLFLKDKNLDILMKCLDGNYKIDDDFKFQYYENPDLQKKVGIKSCMNEILDDVEKRGIFTKAQAELYCECAVIKLFDKGYTYKEMLEIEDENSEIFNEIALPCLNEALNSNPEYQSANSYNTNDIVGGSYRTLIPLVDYLGQGYKLKINISGISKYFLFDTGASDLIIDRETERELLINGALKKDSYLEKTEYVMANNKKIKGQLVKVNNVTIGDYKVNNVIISVIEEGSLLCGKSFLDKFKNWEIDKINKTLILYK
jgi:clan AA aspartic protease (TIGR02281 family)